MVQPEIGILRIGAIRGSYDVRGLLWGLALVMLTGGVAGISARMAPVGGPALLYNPDTVYSGIHNLYCGGFGERLDQRVVEGHLVVASPFMVGGRIKLVPYETSALDTLLVRRAHSGDYFIQ